MSELAWNELEPMKRQVRRWLDRGLGRRWIVAVSGGGDSVALLRALCQLAASGAELELSVAHLDHGARGEAACDDAAFVSALAASSGLPFDLGHWRPARAHHFETDARRARYEWLAEVARARGAHVVAVGHTRDDQIETVLHRIVRGAGLRGLAGMPRCRKLVDGPSPIVLVRPMLDVSRAMARSYLDALGQAHREDPTNDDRSRTRARIRHDLLPKLKSEYNPRIDEALFRLAEFAAAGQRAVELGARDDEQAAVVSCSMEAVVLRHAVMRSLPGPARSELIRRVWRRAGWPEGDMSARRWKRLSDLAAAPEIAPADIGAGIVVSAAGGLFSLRRAREKDDRCSRPAAQRPAPGPVPVQVPVPGAAFIDWAPGRIVLTVRDGGLHEEADGWGRSAVLSAAGPRGEVVDLDRLSLPLVVRAPAAYDRFGPLGMSGKSMSLAAFFRGRKLSAEERARVPLLCDREGIVWVVGQRIADRAKLGPATRKALRMTWSRA